MKSTILLSFGIAFALSARAFPLTIPSDGSDNAFNPTSSVEIDLEQAITGAWDASNSANPGKGRYDAGKWAVVFKYSSVNIPAGVTVTFRNHPSHAPVVWLVQGNVTIAGTLDIRGKMGTTDSIGALTPTEPGPGGFRSGAIGPAGRSGGYGIGGAALVGGGVYGTAYGNPQIIPLIGGSGGSWASYNAFTGSGGGGGGAILIASAQIISVTGIIDARGGYPPPGLEGAGSGGAIRLIAQQMNGGGTLTVVDPSTNPGRIRLETPSPSLSLNTQPNTIAVTPPAIPIIWPADNSPTVRVVSVDGQAPLSDPTAPLSYSTDVPIQNNGTVQVVLQTTNFPVSGIVQLRMMQKYGPGWGSATWLNATYTSGNFTQANWVVNTAFAAGFTTLQVRATVP